MKVCSKCELGYPKPFEDYFSKKPGAPDGLQYTCKKCHNIYVKEHYCKNKVSYKRRANLRNKTVRHDNRQFIWDFLKEHPCVDCGEKDPIVLEFDHINNDKTANVSRLVSEGHPLEKVKLEISKCEVRCANCHKRKTAKQFNYYQGIKL